MNQFDRAGRVVFGLIRTLAWICAGVGMMAWWSSGWSAGALWLRVAGLLGMTVYSPVLFTRLFCTLDLWQAQRRRAIEIRKAK